MGNVLKKLKLQSEPHISEPPIDQFIRNCFSSSLLFINIDPDKLDEMKSLFRYKLDFFRRSDRPLSGSLDSCSGTERGGEYGITVHVPGSQDKVEMFFQQLNESKHFQSHIQSSCFELVLYTDYQSPEFIFHIFKSITDPVQSLSFKALDLRGLSGEQFQNILYDKNIRRLEMSQFIDTDYRCEFPDIEALRLPRHLEDLIIPVSSRLSVIEIPDTLQSLRLTTQRVDNYTWCVRNEDLLAWLKKLPGTGVTTLDLSYLEHMYSFYFPVLPLKQTVIKCLNLSRHVIFSEKYASCGSLEKVREFFQEFPATLEELNLSITSWIGDNFFLANFDACLSILLEYFPRLKKLDYSRNFTVSEENIDHVLTMLDTINHSSLEKVDLSENGFEKYLHDERITERLEHMSNLYFGPAFKPIFLKQDPPNEILQRCNDRNRLFSVRDAEEKTADEGNVQSQSRYQAS